MRECLASADQAFNDREFDEAAKYYDQALALLTKAYPAEHPDVLKCMQNLADCYSFQRNHKKSIELYKRVLSTQEKRGVADKSKLVVTLAKLAKAYEKQGQLKEANSYYKQAITQGQQVLFPGHPLLLSVQESYVHMLKRSQRVQEAMEIEEQIKAARLRQGTAEQYLQPLGAVEEQDDDMETALSGGKAAGSRLRDADLPDAERRPLASGRNLALAVVGLLVVVALGGYFAFSMMRNSSVAVLKAQAGPTYAGKVYLTLSGDCVIHFIDDKIAEVNIANSTMKIPYQVNADSSNISADALLRKVDDDSNADGKWPLSLSQAPEGLLIGESILFADGAPELKLAQRMRRLSSAAQRCFQSTSEYPQDVETLKTVDPALFSDPATSISQVTYLGRVASESDTSLFRPLEAGDSISSEKRDGAPISCYYALSGNSTTGLRANYFFLRGRDSAGRILKSGLKRYFVIALENGHDATTPSTPPEIKPTSINIITTRKQ